MFIKIFMYIYFFLYIYMYLLINVFKYIFTVACTHSAVVWSEQVIPNVTRPGAKDRVMMRRSLGRAGTFSKMNECNFWEGFEGVKLQELCFSMHFFGL